MVRLAGIEPKTGLNPPQPAPTLDFGKSSRVKKRRKVDDPSG